MALGKKKKKENNANSLVAPESLCVSRGLSYACRTVAVPVSTTAASPAFNATQPHIWVCTYKCFSMPKHAWELRGEGGFMWEGAVVSPPQTAFPLKQFIPEKEPLPLPSFYRVKLGFLVPASLTLGTWDLSQVSPSRRNACSTNMGCPPASWQEAAACLPSQQ